MPQHSLRHSERSEGSPASRRQKFLAALGMTMLCLACVASGCAPSKEQLQAEQAVGDYFSGDYARSRELLRPLAENTDQNFVLNNVRLGSASLGDYDLAEAENAFLRAYEVVNSVGVNNGGRSLGAVLVDEKIKVWKGEPFERAMLNFYLGLIYYMRQDYGNARAAFENALFKLRDYKDVSKGNDGNYTEIESNFAAALIMLGRCWQRLGRDDLATATFAQINDMRPDLAALADYDRNLESNLLLVIDVGFGPYKVTTFDGAIVGFAPNPGYAGPPPRPRVRIDGQAINLSGTNVPPFDLLVMAQDRRWQSIDTIRAVKSAVGTGLIWGGLGTSIYGADQGSDAAVYAGLGMMAAGLLLKATSQADTRRWEMLPRTTYILPLKVEPGEHEITIDLPQAPGVYQTWRNIDVPQRGEATYYFRMLRFTSGQFDWPPPALAGTVGATE